MIATALYSTIKTLAPQLSTPLIKQLIEAYELCQQHSISIEMLQSFEDPDTQILLQVLEAMPQPSHPPLPKGKEGLSHAMTFQIPCQTPLDEAHALIHFITQHLQKKDSQESGSIAILIPNLEKKHEHFRWFFKKNMTSDLFEKIFIHSFTSEEKFSEDSPYYLFLNQTLALLKPEGLIQNFSHWVLSPYLKGSDLERGARARLDRLWRTESPLHWSFQNFIDHDFVQTHTPILKNIFIFLNNFLFNPEDLEKNIFEILDKNINLDHDFLKNQKYNKKNIIYCVDPKNLFFKNHFFEKIWLMGFDEHFISPLMIQNPFIPKSISEIYSQNLKIWFSDLQKQTPLLLASYSKTQEGLSVRPHAFLKNFKIFEGFENLNKNNFELKPNFLTPDIQGLPLDSPTHLPGGAGVLKAMAACPFQAYARYRLHLKPLSCLMKHPDAKLKGIMLHEILEKVFSNAWPLEIGYQDRWLDQIQKQIEVVLTKFQKKYPYQLTSIWRKLESQRLEILLKNWLLIEIARPERSLTRSHEIPMEIDLEGLELSIRIDRIDTLETGERLLIDYKSGQASLADWEGERLNEPQLPLYAVLTEAHYAAFAQVNVGRYMKYLGRAVSQEDRFQWRNTLKNLAHQAKSGLASIDPKTSSTCQRCDFMGVCRVQSE